MKKIVSLLVILAMVLSFVPAMPVAHAATHDAPLTNTAKNWFQDTLANISGSIKDMMSVLNTPAVTSGGNLSLGMNQLDAGENQDPAATEYVYVAEKTGTLYVTVVAYGCNGTDWGADSFGRSDETTLTVNGQELSALENEFSVTEGDQVKIVLSSVDGYAYFAKLHLSYEGQYVPALGSEELPIELTYDAVASQSYTVEIPAGEALWFILNGVEFDAAIIEVHGEDAYVVQSYRVWGSREPVEERTDAVNGVAAFSRRSEMIRIGNAGANKATFTITAYIPTGVQENPDDLPVDTAPVTTDIPEGEGSYYFDWTAPANGTLEINLTGDNWFCAVRNLNDNTYDDYAAAWGDSNIITINVEQGDTILFMLSSFAFDNEEPVWPATSITVSASFAAAAGDPLVMGKNQVTVEAGATKELTWTATETGLLAITMAGNNWSYTIDNGQKYASNQTNPVQMHVIQVNAGDVVTVTVGTADNVAGTVTFNAALCQGTVESPIFVDFDVVKVGPSAAMYVQMPAGTYTMSAYTGSPEILYVNGVQTTATVTSDYEFDPLTFTVTVEDASQPCLLEVTLPLGHDQNPEIIVVGSNFNTENNHATVPGGNFMNPGMYCFGWTAAQDTLLALNMLGERWDASFIIRNAEGAMIYDESLSSEDAFLVSTVVLKLKAGEQVLIMLSNWDKNAYEVNFTAYAAAGTEADPVLLSFAWDEATSTGGLNAILPEGEYYYGSFNVGDMELLANEELVVVKPGDRWQGIPATFAINNVEGEPYIYELFLSYPVGNMANPDTLVSGDNVVQVGENSQGYFFEWTAPANGVLYLTFTAQPGWMYAINNMTTYIYGDNQWSDSNPVANPAMVEVKAGHVYQIIVNTYNPANPFNPPAGTVTVNMVFVKEGEHVHNWTPATCTAPKTCSICGATEGTALGHTPGAAATCTTAQTCTVCNAELAPAKGHTPGTAATCTTAQTCTVCNAELAPAKGHTPGAAATCTTAQTCTVCNAELAPAKGHTPGAAATCTTAQTCTVCNAELAPAKGHTPGTAATCTTAQTCTVCNAELAPAKGHTMSDWTVVKPATETEKGEEKRTCSNCDYSETREIPVLGHTCAPVDVAEVKATCTTNGTKAHKKCACGKLYVDGVEVTAESLVIPALGHTWTPATCTAPKTCSVCGATEGEAAGHAMGDWTVVKPATETEKGEEKRTCSNCDYSETREIPVLGHTHTIVKVEAKAATCTEKGHEAYEYCSACDYTTYKEIAALGHTWVDATCTAPKTCSVCGATEGEAKGHTYVDGKCECGATEETDVLLGDVNGDGRINTADAKLIMQYELKLIDASKVNLAAADVNGDGRINTADAKLIMQYELKIITTFPAKKEN